jgi:hypothetical protein
MKRIESPEQRLKNLAREYYYQTMEKKKVHYTRWQDLRKENQQEWISMVKQIVPMQDAVEKIKKAMYKFGEQALELFKRR